MSHRPICPCLQPRPTLFLARPTLSPLFFVTFTYQLNCFPQFHPFANSQFLEDPESLCSREKLGSMNAEFEFEVGACGGKEFIELRKTTVVSAAISSVSVLQSLPLVEIQRGTCMSEPASMKC